MEHVVEQGVSVVLLGHFNPAIVNPDWLASQNVISAEEAAAANVHIIHPDLAHFQTTSFVFDVTGERFVIHATVEPFVRLADMIVDIFGQRLSHTPLSAIGINYHAHFRVQDWRQQTAFGRRLAPVEPWGDWGLSLKRDSAREVGGMASLTMQQTYVPGRIGGNIRVSVEPSSRIEAGFGVYMQVNDHFDRGPDNAEIDFPETCLVQFTPSLERSRLLVSEMITYARGLS